jgi:nucleotide-binding universal stress UspA family protein
MNITDIPAGAVVVGIDGSHDSEAAVDWAARHAAAENRDLVLLCGIGTPESVLGWVAAGGAGAAAYLETAADTSHEIVDQAAARLAEHGWTDRLHTVVTRTEARAALLEASESASLVVVGSRGLGPVKSALFGSVGAALAVHSHCPVVVVRPHHPGVVRRGVLVAVDGTEASPGVLGFAFRQASEQDLPLTVIHSDWDPLVPAHEIPEDDPSFQPTARTLSESLAGLQEKYPDVRVARKLLRGSPRDAISRYADAMDLVVVGHGHEDPVSRVLFGSVALAVLEHASTVVAVVPHA